MLFLCERRRNRRIQGARCASSQENRGQGRNRTGDLSLFRRTLLPTELPGLVIGDRFITAYATPTGLEPATSAVTGRRANQLRHGALRAQGTHPSGRPRNYSAAGRFGGKRRRLQASASDGCRRPLTLWLLVPLRSPSSRGLGLRPFKAATRVRIPLGIQDQTASDKAKHPARLWAASRTA